MAAGDLEQAASILEMLVQLEPHNDQHRTKLALAAGEGGGGRRRRLGAFESDLSRASSRRRRLRAR